MTRVRIRRAAETAIAAAIGMVVSMPAWALEHTRPSKLDDRVRTLTYKPDDVGLLKDTMGNVMMVRFAEDETIVRVSPNDTARLQVKLYKNFMFLKPERLRTDPKDYVLPAQTVIVLTDRGGETRHYQFDFEAQPEHGDPDVVVDMTYPDDARDRRLAALRAARARARHTRALELLHSETTFEPAAAPFSDRRNFSYVARGDGVLAPKWIWDNGYSTVLVFPANQRVPAVFRIDPDGKEASTNPATHGEVVIFAGTSPEWRLRDGATVLAIYNLHYSPEGATPATGTISPHVERTLKGGDDN